MRWFPARLRRRRFTLGTLAVVAALAAAAVPVLATLAGSSGFDAGDANLVRDDDGNGSNDDAQDWINAPNLRTKFDISQSNTDDAYANGAKQDDACPNLGQGSIPPNKDDLVRLLVANDKGSDGSDAGSEPDDYLYLGFERFLPRDGSTASAHMSFEFNKADLTKPAELCNTAKNKVDPLRTAGDLLVVYDFEGGSDPPHLATMIWLTSLGAGDACEAKNNAPCWGNRLDLDNTNSEGAVNQTTVTDPIADPGTGADPPDGWPSLGQKEFGEAAINLQAAGVFTGSGCFKFGAAHLTSRSSGNSFQATLKDTIAPMPVNITNCGSIRIVKTDDQSTPQPLAGATFQLFTDTGAGSTGVYDPDDPNDPNDAFDPAVSPAKSCTTAIVDNGNDPDTAECTISQVPFGTYWVVETVVPTGYLPVAEQSVTVSAGTPNVTVGPLQDRRNPARLKFLKVDDSDPAQPVSGAVFTLFNDDGAGSSGTYDPDDPNDANDAFDTSTGLTCTSGDDPDTTNVTETNVCKFPNILTAGTYWVVETTTPSGYDPAAPVSVTLALGDNRTIGPIVDRRRFKTIVIVCREGTNTLYSSAISINSDTRPNSLRATDLPSNVDEAALCGVTRGAKGGLNKSATAHDADITIGTAALP